MSKNGSKPHAEDGVLHVLLAVAAENAREGLRGMLESFPGDAITVTECGSSTDLLQLAAALQPDVVLAGDKLAPADGFDAVKSISGQWPTISCLLIKPSPSVADYQRALQSGARDLIEYPPDPAALEAAVRAAAEAGRQMRLTFDLAAAVPPAATQARRIAVFSTKGGTGKTFLATNLACGLAKAGKRTALIDMDLQFGDAALALGLTPERTVYDLVQSYSAFDTALLNEFMIKHDSGLHLLPAPLFPDQSERITPDDIRAVLGALETGFDFVVVDGPPFFEERMLVALEWADDILHVASMDVPSIKNTKVSVKMLDFMAFAPEKIHMVMNRSDSKVGLTIEEAERHLNHKIDFCLSSSIEVPRALNAGETLVLTKPDARIATELRSVVELFAPKVDETNGSKKHFRLLRKR